MFNPHFCFTHFYFLSHLLSPQQHGGLGAGGAGIQDASAGILPRKTLSNNAAVLERQPGRQTTFQNPQSQAGQRDGVRATPSDFLVTADRHKGAVEGLILCHMSFSTKDLLQQ